METRTGGRLIRSGLPCALALSVLAHLLVLFALRMTPVETPDPAARPPVRVRLQRAPAPESAPPPPQPRQKPSPMQAPAPPAVSTRIPEAAQPEPGRWMETAREVVRSMGPKASPFLAPDLSHPGLGESAPVRMPGLKAAFRPLPRPMETCGGIVEFKLGIHDISMPVSYPCESRQDELRATPGNATSAADLRNNPDSRP